MTPRLLFLVLVFALGGPSTAAAQPSAQRLLQEAEKASAAQQHLRAVDLAVQATALAPDDDEAWTRLAEYRLAAGQPDLLLSELERERERKDRRQLSCLQVKALRALDQIEETVKALGRCTGREISVVKLDEGEPGLVAGMRTEERFLPKDKPLLAALDALDQGRAADGEAFATKMLDGEGPATIARLIRADARAIQGKYAEVDQDIVAILGPERRWKDLDLASDGSAATLERLTIAVRPLIVRAAGVGVIARTALSDSYGDGLRWLAEASEDVGASPEFKTIEANFLMQAERYREAWDLAISQSERGESSPMNKLTLDLLGWRASTVATAEHERSLVENGAPQNVYWLAAGSTQQKDWSRCRRLQGYVLDHKGELEGLGSSQINPARVGFECAIGAGELDEAIKLCKAHGCTAGGKEVLARELGSVDRIQEAIEWLEDACPGLGDPGQRSLCEDDLNAWKQR